MKNVILASVAIALNLFSGSADQGFSEIGRIQHVEQEKYDAIGIMRFIAHLI